jgi:hypothetical protein
MKSLTIKYDGRSILSTLSYISALGFKTSTLEKRGKRGKVTKYWMIQVRGASPVMIYKLNDLKEFIKASERGIVRP